MDVMKRIIILGSTGSIGRQALQIIDDYPDQFRVVGLAAKDETDLLLSQIQKYKPDVVALGEEKSYYDLLGQIPKDISTTTGGGGLCELAAWPQADLILIALSGAVGILPTLAAIDAGKTVALANKETLVAAGSIVMKHIAEKNITLIPVDSEHSAVFQCLAGEEKHLEKVWLTASGGPFRTFSKEQLNEVTLEMALKHPNWSMGPKITVDSATLMNKGLEVIEAHHLFQVAYEQVKVVIHEESIIHSLVELSDGAFLAHLGWPNMKIPIQYAFTYPERRAVSLDKLDLTALGTLHFSPPDCKRFPCLELAYAAGKRGGSMPAVLNAANEVAVDAFLNHKIRFNDIPHLVEKTMLAHEVKGQPDLNFIMESDKWARDHCLALIGKDVS